MKGVRKTTSKRQKDAARHTQAALDPIGDRMAGTEKLQTALECPELGRVAVVYLMPRLNPIQYIRLRQLDQPQTASRAISPAG